MKIFNKLQALSQNGTNYLCDLQNPDRFYDIVTRKVTRFDDLQTWDIPTNTGGGFFEGLVPTNGTAVTLRLDGTASAKTGEAGYVIIGGNNAAFTVNLVIGFDKLYGTFFALDHDIYLGGKN